MCFFQSHDCLETRRCSQGRAFSSHNHNSKEIYPCAFMSLNISLLCWTETCYIMSCQCCMFTMHAHAAPPRCMSIQHSHASGPCCMSMLHTITTCPCCTPMLHSQVSMLLSTLHVHTYVCAP